MAPGDRTELDLRAFIIAMACAVLVVAVLTPIIATRTFGPPVIIVSAGVVGGVLYKLLTRHR